MAAQQETPKSTAKPASPDPRKVDPKKASGAQGSEQAKPARKGGKLLWLVAAIVLLAGVGGGVSAFLLHTPNEDKAAVQAPPVFVPLETFTVNLLPTDGVQQYLQVNITLKITGQAGADAVKGRMPEVRNRILMLLSSKRANELLSTPGKEKLALQVGDAVRKVVEPKDAAKGDAPAAAEPSAAPADGSAQAQAPRPIEVLFTGLIIQ